LNKGSGNQPGGLQPNSVQNPGETGLEIWGHERASDVCMRILKCVVNSKPVWRGHMLCCQSVETQTLPKDLVGQVLQDMKIVDPSGEVEKRGLSLYFPGGRTEFDASSGGIPTLVMGVSKSHSGTDARSLNSSNAACLGVPGCTGMPPV
jgi:hypothetical protein